MPNSNIETALLACKYLSEEYKAGSFNNYINLLTDDYIFNAPVGAFRLIKKEITCLLL